MQRYILILWLITLSILFAFHYINIFELLVLFLLYKQMDYARQNTKQNKDNNKK